MKTKPEQLHSQLKNQLHAVYIIHGDEALLVQECADQVRAECRLRGFGDRDIIHVDGQFNGEALYASSQAMSLFAEQKIIELRMPAGKPGTLGSKAIIDYLANPNPDNVLLVISSKIDNTAQRSKWFQAIEKAGVCVQIWPVNANDLPRWIDQRLRLAGLSASPDAVELLAEKVEGNLLAAAQEILKLQLYTNDQQITVDTIVSVVADSARYNIFGLIDRCLAGDSRSALKMLHGLKAEGNQLFTILPLFTRELRTLYACAKQIQSGHSIDNALQNQRIWENRKAMTKRALKHLHVSDLVTLLELANAIDQSAKGMSKANGWDLLEQLIVVFSGNKLSLLTVKTF